MRPISDVVVPEPHNLEALAPQPIVSLQIVVGVMERPIGLYDQAVLEAEEVGDERADWDLPTEFEPLQPPIPQDSPESPLHRRHGTAEVSGLGHARRHS
jgi:hypothetical protein